jgi:hypothetical protein
VVVQQVISLENVTEIKTKVLHKGEKVRSAAFLTTKKQVRVPLQFTQVLLWDHTQVV